ncbi:hypothetical protein BKA82DRAFT_4017221 [Pisolithus tinctorius]|nr:hypothetical protein BKA82DRAFT_4017221 [Pisolithus tinctorius]
MIWKTATVSPQMKTCWESGQSRPYTTSLQCASPSLLDKCGWSLHLGKIIKNTTTDAEDLQEIPAKHLLPRVLVVHLRINGCIHMIVQLYSLVAGLHSFYMTPIPCMHVMLDRSPPPSSRDVARSQKAYDPSHLLYGGGGRYLPDGDDASHQHRTIPPLTYGHSMILTEFGALCTPSWWPKKVAVLEGSTWYIDSTDIVGWSAVRWSGRGIIPTFVVVSLAMSGTIEVHVGPRTAPHRQCKGSGHHVVVAGGAEP